MAFERKSPWLKELEKVEKKEEAFLSKRADKKETYLNNLLADKVPEKLQSTLDAAFAKAFRMIFEKGTAVIEKTYNKEAREQNFQISEYSAEVKKNRRSARVFSKKAASTGRINMALSGISGIGMGALGVGLPDIPIFTAMILKSIYEIALSYGFDYDSEEERYFILLVIQGALTYGDEMAAINRRINEFIEERDGEPRLNPEYSQEEMIVQTAGHLSKELLYMKFLQGIPVAGIIGGAYDVVYMKRIVEYAKLKYARRFYHNKK
ncbi:MAG: EcsC family protein [Eubacteriaceae bacterium]|nr:EcsC family protein [Eubacteriaceae bacterium]